MTSPLSVEGIVKEALPGLKFRIEVAGLSHPVIGHIAGRMKINRIRVLAGDRVTVELAPDRKLGRIVRRL
jgi:translation initiation factor IF-1